MFRRIYHRSWVQWQVPPYLDALNPPSPMRPIHAWANRRHLRPSPSPTHLALWGAQLVWWGALVVPWLLRLAILAHGATRHFGPTITARSGKSRFRQFLEQLRFGFQYGLPPLQYYRFHFYDREQQASLPLYLLQHEAGPLSQFLNPDQDQAQMQETIIADKERFAAFCLEQHLPAPPTLGVMGPGRSAIADPGRSFFAKPLRGARGEGTMLWARKENGRYAQAHDPPLAWAQVVQMLAEQAERGPLILQALIQNHPGLADLAPGALCTLRILTGRTPAGEVETIAATFKTALRPDHIISTHGLNSAIDLESGELGRAYTYHPLCAGFEYHPTTGAAIAGRRLPEWPQALALAIAAHEHLPHFTFLGWDVALTPEGPLLLEGNAGWDTTMMQKPQHTPLGRTRFADICMMWLNTHTN